MSKTRRLAILGLSVVATGALFAGTAAADTAGAGVTANETGGTAQANALTISIAGTTITGSAANAALAVSRIADASATQILTPAFTSPEAHATVTSVGTVVKKPDSCTGSQLTQVPGVRTFDITCGSAAASLTDVGGASRAIGAELKIEPSVSNVLSTIQLQGPAQQATSQVIAALNPLVQGLTGTPLKDLVTSADQTVQDVLNKILTLQSTARIVVAPALAEVTADAKTVTSHAHAQGIRIELLPVDGAGATNNLLPDDLQAGKPLITITVGNAEVTKTVAKDGSSAPKADAQSALVTVELGSTALAKALNIPSKIEVQGGQHFCVPGLDGTPLATCIDVATAGVDANGNPYADGVSVNLFKGVNGGILVSTGQAGSTGQSILPTATLAATQTPDLPRTGGNPALPLIGGGLLCAALVTRRYTLGRR